MGIDWENIRNDFSIPEGRIFLDNGAGTFHLKSSIDAVNYYLSNYGGVSMGGQGKTARIATALIEEVYTTLANFIGARSTNEISFQLSATDALNHLARWLYDGGVVNDGDHIVVTPLDHESNVSPWLQLRGVKPHFVKLDKESGTLDMEDLVYILHTHKPKLVAVTAAANTIGTINDIHRISELARAIGALMVVDAVHYAAHAPIDVKALGADFLVLNMYKIFGPHAALLYTDEALITELKTFQLKHIPDGQIHARFSRGGQPWANWFGAASVVEWIKRLGCSACEKSPEISDREMIVEGMSAIRDYEHSLMKDVMVRLLQIDNVEVYGIKDPDSKERVATVVFRVKDFNSEDIVREMDEKGVEVRAGHFYGVRTAREYGVVDDNFNPIDGGFIRITLAPYIGKKDIDQFFKALDYAIELTSGKS